MKEVKRINGTLVVDGIYYCACGNRIQDWDKNQDVCIECR